MSIFKAVVSGTWALFLGVLVPKHSIALADVVTVIESIQSCDKLSETYDAAGADIVVRLEGDMACAKAKVRSLLVCTLYNADVVCACCGQC